MEEDAVVVAGGEDVDSGGMKGESKVVVEQHRLAGVFIARSKEDALCTLNSKLKENSYILTDDAQNQCKLG